MTDKTGIEWTDATWNPTVGCSLVSPGCKRCYAMRVAWRLHHGEKYRGLVELAKDDTPVWTGAVRPDEAALDLPLRWRRPRRIFVNSMSDLFHEALPDEAIDRVFAVMILARRHTFQILTKRAERMQQYITTPGREAMWSRWSVELGKQWDRTHGGVDGWWPRHSQNIWLGVSVEDQERADERIPHLLATPARVHFLSCEPLLGALDLDRGLRHLGKTIDWVICGGESGPGARPMHPDWARSLRDQCAAAGVAFHFKQWGEFAPYGIGGALPTGRSEGKRYAQIRALDEHTTLVRCGKKRAGRLLDGREHNAFPAQGT